VPYLDVVASRSADGKHIFIKAVNTDAQRTLRTSVRIGGVHVASNAVMETISADSMTSANSFATPHTVSLHQKTIKTGPNFVIDFPQHSVSVITLDVPSATAVRPNIAVVSAKPAY
jgi:alpha-L-arabinofuranosidase